MPISRHGVKRQHPNSGVRLDFENLLKTFTETETVRYENFAEIWRKMQFSMLCAGRQSDREVREFMDECFHIALSYYLPPYNFQVRVGGLYLIYGLYFTQLCFPKSKIRVSSDQWKQILEFQEDAKGQQHLDVEFCYQKLLFKHAFHFVATTKQIYPRSSDPIENVNSEMPEELKETEGCVQKMFSPNVLEELSAVHTQYEKIKIGLAGPEAERPVRSLDMIQSQLVDNIMSRLEAHNEKLTKLNQQIQQKKALLELSDDDDPTFEPSESNIAKLKAKAFSGMAKQTRSQNHRLSVSRDLSSEPSPSKSGREAGNGMALGLSDDDDDDSSEDYDTMVDSLIKMKQNKDFLPMPSLTTEKVNSPKKASSKTVKKALKKELKEQKKQRNRSGKKDGGKTRKKRIQSESEMDSSITPKKKKRKRDNTQQLPPEETPTHDCGDETDLPKIKAKQRKPRKKKGKAVLDKSENVDETGTDVNEDVLLPNKQKGLSRKGKVKAQPVTDNENNAGDTAFSDPAGEMCHDEIDLNVYAAKKKPVKRKNKNEVVVEKTEEAASSSNKNGDEKNSLDVGSDAHFSSPTRKRKQRKKKSTESLPITTENKTVGEKEVDPNTELPSPRKKQRLSRTEAKLSDESNDAKGTKNGKNKKQLKESTQTQKAIAPKTRPVPIEKKEKTPKKKRKKKDN